MFWALALFVTAQLGLAVAIEWWLPELRDPRYACRAAKLCPRAVVTEPKPLTLVMLGSSRVQDGLNSSELEARLRRKFSREVVMFNFGLAAAGPVANLLHFQRLRAAGVKPELLLVEVVPTLFAGQDQVAAEAAYFQADRLWHHELATVAQYGLPGDALRRDWWQDWPVPCHGHRFAIMSLFLPRFLPYRLQLIGDRQVDQSGWCPRNTAPRTPEQRRQALAYAWKDFGVPLASFRLSGAACRAQRELLRRCREEHIAAALVWMPEGKEFQRWYPADAETQIRRYLDDLGEEFGVPLVDARDWVEDEGFIDSQHLHASGAAVFTERLGREVLEQVLALPRETWGRYLASRRQLGEAGGPTSVARRQETTVGAAATR
ncbi:MAG TPA: hypothetical protein VMV69_05830 [Pirellulales bacterium]|nr:hypothetical protein [Pirellulales bacterium]